MKQKIIETYIIISLIIDLLKQVKDGNKKWINIYDIRIDNSKNRDIYLIQRDNFKNSTILIYKQTFQKLIKKFQIIKIYGMFEYLGKNQNINFNDFIKEEDKLYN